jgi:hypothetical protein
MHTVVVDTNIWIRAIVTGDADLRADDDLRAEMAKHGIEIWGIDTLLSNLGNRGTS